MMSRLELRAAARKWNAELLASSSTDNSFYLAHALFFEPPTTKHDERDAPLTPKPSLIVRSAPGGTLSDSIFPNPWPLSGDVHILFPRTRDGMTLTYASLRQHQDDIAQLSASEFWIFPPTMRWLIRKTPSELSYSRRADLLSGD